MTTPRYIACLVLAKALNGLDGQTQGAVMVELLAILLAGQPAENRDELLEQHIHKVREILPATVREFEEFEARLEKQKAKMN